MKTNICLTLTFMACCAIPLVQGCGEKHDHETVPAHTASQDAHAALHKPKYNEVLAEFPGHKYAIEITHDKEATGLVIAFLTDAHFGLVAADAAEVRLNFAADGHPKTYTLLRSEQEEGKPATFTLTDMELAALLAEGWQGSADAVVEIGGTRYSAKLVKISGHENHDH